MRAHDWFIEHRSDFVTRGLDADDERLYRDHLSRCAECREAVAVLERALAYLPMGVTPVAPRPGFTQRVVRDVVGSRRRRVQWYMPAVAAASILLALAGWWAGRQQATRTGQLLAAVRDTLGAARDTLAAAQDTLGVLREANRIVQASIEMHGQKGGIVIFADEKTHRWRVVVHGLPAAPEGERYAFWFVTGDGMVRGPDVAVSPGRPASMVLDMPPGARLIKGGALPMEPMQGDDSTPRGPELAHLEL